MKKRGILLSKPVKTRKTGQIITAQMVNEILILNCYKDKKLIARYCMSSNDNQYESFVNGKWVHKKIFNIFGYEDWQHGNARKDIKLNSNEDEKIVDLFFKKTCISQLDELDQRESSHLRKKAETAYEKKVKRIDALMEMIPTLPDDFEKWSSKVMFNDEEFMFYDKEKDNYFCTACGKEHIEKNLKHNEKWICNRTKHEVIVKRRQQSIMKKERCMVIQNMDNTRSVARHFTVDKVWNKEGSTFEAYEDVRYILYKDGSKRVQWFYGQYTKADEFRQDWWDTNRSGKHCLIECCYPGTCREGLKNTVYENMDIPLMAEKGWKLCYNRVMANHKICGFLEYMVKGNFERLTRETSEEFSCWGGYCGSLLNLEGNKVHEIFGVDMQRVNRLRQKNGGMNYLRWLKWEQENRSLPEDTIQWLENNNIRPEDIEFMENRMSPVQIANYLKRQEEESKKSISGLLDTWKDYLSMAERIKMDSNNEMIFRPKKLKHSHDELVLMIEQKDAAIKAGEMLLKYEKVDNICAELKEKYEFEDEIYAIVAPRGIEDIIVEGKILQHCMDKTDRYFDRINQRETYILFLRKKEDVNKPYYTLEVEPSGTIRQKRTLGDRQNEDIEEAKKFLTKWQKEIQKRTTEEDKKLGEDSRRMRIEGYRKLREENSRIRGGYLAGTLLADVLEADLMEINTDDRKAG